ncbi:MAG: aspartyl protease family protein [Candidatus Eremiobacteraeota bacterium]|nr:aspartyl protease family protein [Candidatus Eremiobacteraeota bacterium]
MSVLLALAVFACSALADAAVRQASSGATSAEALYKAGRFNEARAAFERLAAIRPNDYSAVAHLGYIALFSNRYDDAVSLLNKAIKLKPADARPRFALAQVFYRRDDFRSSAKALKDMPKADPTIAGNYSSMYPAKLAGFGAEKPNVVSTRGPLTRLKFVKLNPLPVVRVRVNGKDALFFLDTGGGETVIDSALARELKIEQFGSVKGTFSGGQKSAVGNGRIGSLGLGSWAMQNVPVQILDTRRFSSGFGVKQLDGILGTVVYYHFLTTFDYRRGELVLRRRTDTNAATARMRGVKPVAVPFWLAGDHFIVAQGRVNALQPMLFFVDTGVAGAGAKLTKAVIARAAIRLEQNKATEGMGAGGSFRSVPYVIPKLSLGGFSRGDVPGIFDGPLPIATVLDFEVPGMIGHEAFLRHSITFDFSAMRMLIE